VPETSFSGPALEFDFPALHVGVAEYQEGPTGMTLFYFPKRAMAVVDVRGGAPGTTITDALRLGYERANIDAVTFAGGSYYGLQQRRVLPSSCVNCAMPIARPASPPCRARSFSI
jgi:L-aminopeptidase/D-esterase-like protein